VRVRRSTAFPFIFRLQIEIPNWTTIDTLEKHNLVSKSILGDDLKYALTEGGREVAAKFSQEYQLEQRNLRDAGLAEES
jgi:DNA-binding PadR family transcriptional regulator